MDHFAGLDVSVKETSVCIVDDVDKIVREVKVASEPEPERLLHLVFESYGGRALVPSPKRSASPRATSTLQWRIGLKALDPERPIREEKQTPQSVDGTSVKCHNRS
jgi:hypothetical protein